MAKKYNPTFKIDLLKVLDNAFTSDELKDKLRPFISKTEFKQIYGQRVVDRIVERTQDSKGAQVKKIEEASGEWDSGTPSRTVGLGSYSTSYRNSLIFKIYKEGEKKVNLTLTGEMLASLNPVNGRYTITVELEGENNKAKAQGHITGKYGKTGKSDPRPFLFLPTKEVSQIFVDSLKDFRDGAIMDVLAESLV